MPRAVLQDGVIHLLDPLPPEWKEGQELRVEEVAQESTENGRDIEEAFQDIEAIAAEIDPEDDKRLPAILVEIRREARERARREAGMP